MSEKFRKKRLKSLNDIRKYLATLVNETRNGQIDLTTAGKLAYMLNILRGVISEGDLEMRIKALEAKEGKQ